MVLHFLDVREDVVPPDDLHVYSSNSSGSSSDVSNVVHANSISTVVRMLAAASFS
jgi:hypothetical protein